MIGPWAVSVETDEVFGMPGIMTVKSPSAAVNSFQLCGLSSSTEGLGLGVGAGEVGFCALLTTIPMEKRTTTRKHCAMNLDLALAAHFLRME